MVAKDVKYHTTSPKASATLVVDLCWSLPFVNPDLTEYMNVQGRKSKWPNGQINTSHSGIIFSYRNWCGLTTQKVKGLPKGPCGLRQTFDLFCHWCNDTANPEQLPHKGTVVTSSWCWDTNIIMAAVASVLFCTPPSPRQHPRSLPWSPCHSYATVFLLSRFGCNWY